MNTEKLQIAARQGGVEMDLFYFDPKLIDWEDYFMNIHIPGIVKYVFKWYILWIWIRAYKFRANLSWFFFELLFCLYLNSNFFYLYLGAMRLKCYWRLEDVIVWSISGVVGWCNFMPSWFREWFGVVIFATNVLLLWRRGFVLLWVQTCILDLTILFGWLKYDVSCEK